MKVAGTVQRPWHCGRMAGFDPALGRAFNFSADELEANRDGRLSSDQELMWRNTVRVWGHGTRRGALMLGFGVLGAAVAAVAVGSRTPGTSAGSSIVVVVVILGFILLLGGFFVRRGRRATQALARAELRDAVGEFSWTSDLNARWWGRIGEARFGIDRLQEEALETGATYRVHYLPSDGAAWVLSIERI